ncbi:hypothetical protein INS49_000936 [Diaporthe citri]|uniref:uncharacterized protein n=1 Tax=Diaporthe citri TaxID=83186 RepID=UPI001C804760|nr:uncharacterized protein INS49_000936 [Diaporthe citri]KAG6366756.1 hypothetical protein INS49_000936 [Diaporthe citri]
MARSRFPAPFAVTLLILRFLSLAFSVSALLGAAYTAANYGYGRAMVGAFIASVWTMVVDTTEIFGLTDHTRRTHRCTEGSLGFLDLLTILLNAILPAVNLPAATSLSWECGGLPQDQCEEEEQFRSETLNAAFATWVLLIVLA